MISLFDQSCKEIDIIIVTPGGSAQQVAKFVNRLRPRFENVSFIIPNIAMSAGTIFVMSGDDIIMGPNAYIGPIDPQVVNKDGLYVPAQAILTLIEDIQERGAECIKKGTSPPWTDMQILSQIDAKEIGNALSASKYSIELVKNFLYNYKFKKWTNHSSDGRIVTNDEKMKQADDIATFLCSHKEWKSHSRGITRKNVREECKIKILDTEDIVGLDRVIRRFWALMYWIFENTAIAKIFISNDYCIMRNDPSLLSISKR
jgi:membrane-bound ClpP family serine protease